MVLVVVRGVWRALVEVAAMVILIVLTCLSAAAVLGDSFRVSVIVALCLTVFAAVASLIATACLGTLSFSARAVAGVIVAVAVHVPALARVQRTVRCRVVRTVASFCAGTVSVTLGALRAPVGVGAAARGWRAAAAVACRRSGVVWLGC